MLRKTENNRRTSLRVDGFSLFADMLLSGVATRSRDVSLGFLFIESTGRAIVILVLSGVVGREFVILRFCCLELNSDEGV